MVNVVVVSYLSITQLMYADEKMEWERKMVSVSYGVLAFGNFCLIFHLCHVSEMVVTVEELEKVIIDDLLKNGESQQQNAVCNHLLKFKGFNANGYFTLNHSMSKSTGMIANIITYLVILVEFKQSGF